MNTADLHEAREANYQRLGRTKGPDSTCEARATLRHWWMSQAAEAAPWLVARIREEHHWDVLHAVIAILTTRREDTVEAVVAELDAGLLGDDARLCLLKVLAESVLDGLTERVGAVLPAHGDDLDEREVLEDIRAKLSVTG